MYNLGRLAPAYVKVVTILEFMGTKAASEKWNIPQSTLSKMCRNGKIKGAEQDKPNSPWRIPINAEKPKYTARKTKGELI